MVTTAGAWVLCPERSSGVGLYKMASEFLMGRLGEHGLFPEVEGDVAIGLRNSITCGLGEVAQGGRCSPWQRHKKHNYSLKFSFLIGKLLISSALH